MFLPTWLYRLNAYKDNKNYGNTGKMRNGKAPANGTRQCPQDNFSNLLYTPPLLARKYDHQDKMQPPRAVFIRRYFDSKYLYLQPL
jgi:hypothetical protein